ncbi:MAG: TolC family protein [Bryobacteraceae bacterium]
MSCSRAAAQQAPPPKPVVIDLREVLRRARSYSQQFQTAVANAAIAREGIRQARAAELPTVNALNQFLYTQGNGTPSGVFVANDGVHVYNEQAVVRQNLFSLVRRGEYRLAAAAVAAAQKEIAARGLVVTVVQDYYNVAAAERKVANADRALHEAGDFLDLTQKQEQAGDVSHVDVVKAQLQVEQRERDSENSKLVGEQARLTLSVLLSADFDEDFTIVDDLSDLQALSAWSEVQAQAFVQNPEMRAAQASLREARSAISVAKYAYLPSLALTFYYGFDANQFAARTNYPTAGVNRSNLPNFLVPHRQNLGYAGDITLDIPVWNWGATCSKIRQAEFRGREAQTGLSATQRQLRANLRAFFQEAETARAQVASFERSQDFAAENIRLTLLRYQAGDATALEVVTAEDALSLARNAYDDGLARFHVALAKLQTLTGSM